MENKTREVCGVQFQHRPMVRHRTEKSSWKASASADVLGFSSVYIRLDEGADGEWRCSLDYKRFAVDTLLDTAVTTGKRSTAETALIEALGFVEVHETLRRKLREGSNDHGT